MPMKLWAADGNAEPYAVLSDNDTKLTFYYDDQREARGGMSVAGSFAYPDYQPWHSQAVSITSAEFDPSFANCTTLTSTRFWFYDCKNMGAIFGIQYLKTDNVTDMWGMFGGCSGLTSLDLSGFNTANVKSMGSMFEGCSGLTKIFAGDDWNTALVTDGGSMFSGCTSLVGGAGTAYDANHTDHTYAHIDGGAANPGYFTDKNAPVSSDDLEIYAVEHNSTIVPNETIAATPSIRLTPGNDTQWNTEYSIAIDNDSEDLTIDFTASIYYPDYTTTYEFLGSMYGTNNPKDSLLADGVSGGTGYKYYLRNLPLSGGYIVFEALQDGSLIVPVHINPKKQFYVVDANGKVKTDIQLKDASGQTLTMLSSPLCAVSDEKSVTAFASFNVKKGESYYMFCTGSKMRFGGYVFSKLSIDIDPVTMAAVKNELESSPVEYDGLVLRVGSDVSMGNALRAVGGISAVGSNIAAIVWNSTTPLSKSELQELTNPNMLIYVAADSLAPQNRDNIIVGDVAKNIVLTDAATGNNNFYVPQQFTAESISYTRNFQQQTQVGVSRGWESIALPFDVQSVKHEKQSDIAPFGSTESGKHFWLRRLTPDGLQRATRIEANVPYVLSMPNNEEYSAEYNLGGRVTFSAQNATVPVTAAKVTALADSSITMVPTTVAVGRSSSVWALNVGQVRGSYLEGSVFERDYREVRPFEAYTVHRQGSSDDDNPSPRMIPVQKLMGSDATGIEEVRAERSEVSGDRWYDLNGRRLQARPTAKGVYIKDGRKVVIK